MSIKTPLALITETKHSNDLQFHSLYLRI